MTKLVVAYQLLPGETEECHVKHTVAECVVAGDRKGNRHNTNNRYCWLYKTDLCQM